MGTLRGRCRRRRLEGGDRLRGDRRAGPEPGRRGRLPREGRRQPRLVRRPRGPPGVAVGPGRGRRRWRRREGRRGAVERNVGGAGGGGGEGAQAFQLFGDIRRELEVILLLLPNLVPSKPASFIKSVAFHWTWYHLDPKQVNWMQRWLFVMYLAETTYQSQSEEFIATLKVILTPGRFSVTHM